MEQGERQQQKTKADKRPRKSWVKVLLVSAIALVFAVVGLSGVADARRGGDIAVDVAEDPSRFVFGGDHLIEEGDFAGLPDYGDGFITQGWIFEEGTLSEGDPGVDCEFNEDGYATSCEPLYEPIGRWTCHGYHVGDGAATAMGHIVVTTQIFEFDDDGETHTIVTDGFESAEVGAVDERAIVGGTGDYSRARGTQRQTQFGLHPDFFNIRLQQELSWNK